jgi:hypothetical protein
MSLKFWRLLRQIDKSLRDAIVPLWLNSLEHRIWTRNERR